MKMSGKHAPYYAVICSDAKYATTKMKASRLICGVFASRKEAEEMMEKIKGCVLTHYIRRVSLTIETWKP